MDDNQASFTDPTTHTVQNDLLDVNGNPYAGNVWVGWSTSETIPQGFTPTDQWNPNSIQVVSSSNGGQSFTSPLVVNDNGRFGHQRDATPKIVISQGGGGATGGQASIIWDDNGSGATASPRFDLIDSSRIQDGGTAEVYVGPGGPIIQATDPGGGADHIPQTTSYPVTVNITDPKFISLTNVTVTMNLQQAALGEIQADLIAPDGTTVNLFLNQTDAAGPTPPNPPSASRGRTWESPLAVNSWGRFSISRGPEHHGPRCDGAVRGHVPSRRKPGSS